MPNTVDSLAMSFGPLTDDMTNETGSIGTTAAEVAAVSTVSSSTSRLVRIRNTHADQDLAFAVVASGGSSSITADGSSTDGTIVPAASTETIVVRNDKELWLVGSAASTTYNLLVKNQ